VPVPAYTKNLNLRIGFNLTFGKNPIKTVSAKPNKNIIKPAENGTPK